VAVAELDRFTESRAEERLVDPVLPDPKVGAWDPFALDPVAVPYSCPRAEAFRTETMSGE
jgi:hypothetical protein